MFDIGSEQVTWLDMVTVAGPSVAQRAYTHAIPYPLHASAPYDTHKMLPKQPLKLSTELGSQ